MACFRNRTASSTDPVTPDAVRRLADEMIAPAHFFHGPGLRLEWIHVAREELVWEIYRGRLLAPAHTRQRQTFEAWNVYAVGAEGRSSEPVLALKLDLADCRLYVVRGLECYIWEGYDAGDGVILSRERCKWVRELAGVVELQRFANTADLRDELACQLFHAIVGRRLPLTSVEAPLPAFSFGQLFYCYRPGASLKDTPLRIWRELLAQMLTAEVSWLEKAKLLEMLLHAVPFDEIAAATTEFTTRWTNLGHTPTELAALFRTLFNDASLTPWTDLTDKMLTFLDALEQQGILDAAAVIDFLGHLLRQLGRHLTAYDLVTFHHRGANYPDALLLDAVLKAYLVRIEHCPELFLDKAEDEERTTCMKRLRRRALRQGWLLRRRYENHLVPDLPTSPGENNRVLPASHPRVPEEQILQTARRTKQLYADDPLTNHLGKYAVQVLRQSVADLSHPAEQRELGLALFLDRPLGDGKALGEPDTTPLLSCEAYSRTIAAQRLRALAGEDLLTDCVRQWPEAPSIHGLPLEAIGVVFRPGVVSLADARQATSDFVFLRTTPTALQDLLELFDFTPLASQYDMAFLSLRRQALVARAATGAALIVYDEQFRPRLELVVVTRDGYTSRAGREYPPGGLLVVRVWDPVTLYPQLLNIPLKGL